MDSLRTDDLLALARIDQGPCISLYMPTHGAGPQRRQDAVRLKNLLKQAEENLSERWLRRAEARTLLETARQLPVDRAFWQKRSEGLALFIAADQFQAWRLPLAFDEFLLVQRRFHLKPLLPLWGDESRYFVLALSQHQVRFLAGSRFGLEEVQVPNLPANMQDVLEHRTRDEGLQFHSVSRGDRGRPAAMFHGHGGVADTHKDDLAQIFRKVDEDLQPLLRDQTAPLLLAGVDYLLPIYRQVNSYAHLASEELPGNWEQSSPAQLYHQAWPVVEPHFRQAREAAAEKFRRLAGTGLTADDPRQILLAAHQGRIETLLFDPRATCWGTYQPETGDVTLHSERTETSDDLIDRMAVETVLHRGAVYAVDGQQATAPASAVFRY